MGNVSASLYQHPYVLQPVRQDYPARTAYTGPEFFKLIMAVDAANSCFGAASHVSAAGG